MKRFILFILLSFVFAGFSQSFAQSFEWYTANQATIAWDAVTKLSDDSDIPIGSTVKYKIYLRDKQNIVTENQEVSTLSATITFTTEGQYHIGVSTVRYEGTTEMSESEINWSDVNGVGTPNPFGLRFYRKPGKPKGLKMQ